MQHQRIYGFRGVRSKMFFNDLVPGAAGFLFAWPTLTTLKNLKCWDSRGKWNPHILAHIMR